MTPHHDVDELIPTERVAVVLWRLYGGERMTVAEIAQYVGISPRAVRYMLDKVARVLPICQGIDGRWGNSISLSRVTLRE